MSKFILFLNLRNIIDVQIQGQTSLFRISKKGIAIISVLPCLSFIFDTVFSVFLELKTPVLKKNLSPKMPNSNIWAVSLSCLSSKVFIHILQFIYPFTGLADV